MNLKVGKTLPKTNLMVTKKKILLLILFIVLTISAIYFSSNKDDQRTGEYLTKRTAVITKTDIDDYLKILDKERFTRDDKVPIRDFIKSEFSKYNYKITEQKFGEFSNIIAYRDEPNENDILIGAHYDSLQNMRGMDDNASGVAILLALAKHNENPRILFVAFDAEEFGMLGSKYYIQNTHVLPQLAISLETVGYYTKSPNTQVVPTFFNLIYRGLFNRLKSNDFRGDFSASVCSRNAKEFCDTYESYASHSDLNVYTIYISSLPFIKDVFVDLFRSDHTPFYLKDIPAVMITDTAEFRNPNYHKTTDTIETVDLDFATKQANALLWTLSDL